MCSRRGAADGCGARSSMGGAFEVFSGGVSRPDSICDCEEGRGDETDVLTSALGGGTT